MFADQSFRSLNEGEGVREAAFPAVLRRRSDLKGHLPLPAQHIHRCGDESYDLLWPRRRGASPLVIGFH